MCGVNANGTTVMDKLCMWYLRRILNFKDTTSNLIVLGEEGWDSYIYNRITDKSIPIRQENNVYVLYVEYMIEDEGEYVEVPFRRQAYVVAWYRYRCEIVMLFP